MQTRSVMNVAGLAPLLLGLQSACAQGGPASGLYQIVSGRYVACCGLAGPMIQPLPNAGDAFVQLTVDSQNNQAWITFLGQDKQTTLRIPAEGPRSEFSYALSNGMVFPDRVTFGGPLPPEPSQSVYSFVISNSADTLWINGTVIVPCPGCADVPEHFQHTNVVAVLMPAAAIRVSEIEVCWNSVSNRTYQVQYQSSLTTNEWVELGSPISGSGSNMCVTDKVPLGQPQRHYRVVRLP